jgi:hypothetical protein
MSGYEYVVVGTGTSVALRGIVGPLTPGPAVRRHPIAEAGLEAAGQAGYSRVRPRRGCDRGAHTGPARPHPVRHLETPTALQRIGFAHRYCTEPPRSGSRSRGLADPKIDERQS